MSDQTLYAGKIVMFTHNGTAVTIASLPEGTTACRPEPLLAQPGELAVGRAEPDPWTGLAAAAERLASRDLGAEAEAAIAASPQAAWLRQARAVMNLLATISPPTGFFDAVHSDEFGSADRAWAWLRRQAGLEGA